MVVVVAQEAILAQAVKGVAGPVAQLLVAI
jgi:hypothetical protein